MPYIIMKRNDVANGVLQILDIQPNTSLRNQSIDPPGQSKYVRVPLNDRLVTVGAGPVTTYVESKGLGAWFLTNVPATAGVAASQTGTLGVGGFAPGEDVAIGVVISPETTLTAVAAAPGVREFVVTGNQLTDTASLVNAINNPANGFTDVVTAVDNGGGSLTVTAVTPGTDGNNIQTVENGANFAWGAATLAGGVNATAITAAQASTIATNLFTNLLRFGDNANPALAMDLAAVNAEIAAVVATASITANQLTELLDVLSGRLYVLPQGVQIEDAANDLVVDPPVGSVNGPRFDDPSFRRSYESDDFVISWSEGSLFEFRQDTFEYLTVTGAIVAVYNDDGSLYTPPLV